ncbi:MAG: hypothetical protein ACFBZ9_13765 [Sphingomonadales bacterium]
MIKIFKVVAFGTVFVAAHVIGAQAAEPVRYCLAVGDDTFGTTGMIFYSDGRSMKVDSPYQANPNSRFTRWEEPGYFEKFTAFAEPYLGDMPGEEDAACTGETKDTLSISYSDGTVTRWDSSCDGNQIAKLREGLAMKLPAFAESPTKEEYNIALAGIYDPCSKDW